MSKEYHKFPPDVSALKQYNLTFDDILEARECKILSGKAVIVQKACSDPVMRKIVEKAGGKIVAVNAFNKAEVIIDSKQAVKERQHMEKKSKQ